MLEDILRHLKKKRSKISLALISLIVTTYFFRNQNLSIFNVIICVVVICLGFLIISWGKDNPENN